MTAITRGTEKFSVNVAVMPPLFPQVLANWLLAVMPETMKRD